MRVLRRADSKLQTKYNMKATFGQSALDKDAKTGASGKKISVLWNSQLIQEEEFQVRARRPSGDGVDFGHTPSTRRVTRRRRSTATSAS